ncbi:uncharacterized protein MELLADRAFT_73508 [Melampsora larici-populina 98AG31]|uniref:Uncharacterized protein n=1 Tax=Melampsora larici-populina (strain 98AG31 / pathotype 3-4-7) TaxID=747676 RepID=F4S956_MELLP|nr:uncharacterized protein MELLADRAFT_73508 [Melampsora larici-populina 98AG31]EGF98760.1 hypothetical protein MELLADRAFT_73508 [Melampsora larici-populina 98AG31]
MAPLPSSTLPLVSSSSSSNTPNLQTSNPTSSNLPNNPTQSTSINPNQSQSKNLNIETEIDPNQISSPLELIGWVDSVLSKLETKFSRIEVDVLDRLDLLGKRIDSLETSMSELMEGAGGATTVSSGPSTAALTSELSPVSGPSS